MKNDRNTSLGLPADASAPEPARTDATAVEIDITKDRLGEILSGRRHQLGLRIEEIAEDIKIRPDYLRAIEQELFDQLPTVEYGRLFLKSYAERLGLNVNDIYALYDVHHRPAWEPPKPRTAPGDSRQPIGPTPRLPAAKPIPSKFWVYLIIGIIALALVILGVLRLTKPADGSPSDSQIQQDAQPTHAEVTPPEPVQTAPTATAAPESGTTSNDIVIDAEMLLAIKFDRDTWIKMIADNDTIASGIYHAGQTVQGKGFDRFVLSLGHTQGVEASVNGHPLKSFASWTNRFSGMVITADSVAAWMLPTPVTRGPIQ